MQLPQSRSGCPIATTLDCMGDSWTLVIVRDMLTGKSRYGEFLTSPEGITTNILASRLVRMETLGVIVKSPYQTNPLRHEYKLTETGHDLAPVLQAMCRWGNLHFPDTWVPPESFMKL